jgi:hypothetical protein
MAAGLGYKEFTTGDVLTAADANGYLASQVVMVFASAAARTSAIASPQEGMISYLKDTNSTEYYSGSAWRAIGGSSDIVRISTVPFTSSSAVNLNDIFSSTYTNYMVVLNITASPSTGNLQARMRVSSADNTTSNYYSVYEYIDSASVTAGSTKNAAASFWQLSFISSEELNIPFIVSQPFQTESTSISAPAFLAGATYKVTSAGSFNATTSFTGMSFLTSAGTITGEAIIYGMKRA